MLVITSYSIHYTKLYDFESLMGVKLKQYKSFKTPEEALNALTNHQVQAIWASDVTGEYLVKTNENP